MTRHLLPAALVGAALTVAACGGDDGTATAADGPDAKTKQAMLDFAACMRDHGVDMPDPKFDGGPSLVRGGRDASPERARKAEEACAKYREKIKPPKLSEAEQAAFKKAALANARCMRAHGVDMPDPTFSEDGGATVRIGKGAGAPRIDDAKFRAAAEACKDTMPKLRPGR
jgi:hypothetical protein